jgi:hypothetical protein
MPLLEYIYLANAVFACLAVLIQNGISYRESDCFPFDRLSKKPGKNIEVIKSLNIVSHVLERTSKLLRRGIGRIIVL